MKQERKKERGHLNLKAMLAAEVAQGLYPDLRKDLLYMKACNEGLRILPHDPSLSGKSISKIEALKVLMQLDLDLWEVLLVFQIIPNKYEDVLR